MLLLIFSRFFVIDESAPSKDACSRHVPRLPSANFREGSSLNNSGLSRLEGASRIMAEAS